MIPVLPDLLKELSGLSNSDAVIHGGYLTLVFAVMQFIFMPIIGGLSDRFGRRPVMLVSLFGLSLDYFIMGFAPTLAFLYFGRIIVGITGATFTTANAYIADISPPETRAQNFGLVGALFGVGFMLGPVIGGLTGIKGLISVIFLLALAHTVYPTTYTFTMNEAFGWDSVAVGWSLGAFGVASIIVQGGLIRIIIPKIGLYWAGMIGIIAASIAYVVMGGANAGWMIYAAGPFAAFAGLANPALTGMMSNRMGETVQGELQGAIGAAQGLAMMIGPIIMTRSFQKFTQDTTHLYIPGAPFLLAASLAIFAFASYVLFTNASDRQPLNPK